jgi:hypothetical protein
MLAANENRVRNSDHVVWQPAGGHVVLALWCLPLVMGVYLMVAGSGNASTRVMVAGCLFAVVGVGAGLTWVALNRRLVVRRQGLTFRGLRNTRDVPWSSVDSVRVRLRVPFKGMPSVRVRVQTADGRKAAHLIKWVAEDLVPEFAWDVADTAARAGVQSVEVAGTKEAKQAYEALAAQRGR